MYIFLTFRICHLVPDDPDELALGRVQGHGEREQLRVGAQREEHKKIVCFLFLLTQKSC